MCRLHDNTPSLIRVWFLELWEGCVAQYAVYSHRAMGEISQGGYWHWISKRRGLGIGCWSLGNCNSWHLWQLSPLQLDTVVYGCKDVCMSPCVYMRVWSYMRRSQNQYCGSPGDKACTDIVPPQVDRYPFLFPPPYRAIGPVRQRLVQQNGISL